MGEGLDVVVIGTIIKETIHFANGRVEGPVLGSPAAYSSLVMAAQGVKVGLISYYGDDMEGPYGELSAVDRSGNIKHDHSTTNLLIYRQDGTKYVEYQKRAPRIGFDDISDYYLKTKNFKICPMDYEVDLDVVERLHAAGKNVYVDLGGYGGATSDVRHSINEKYGRMVIDTLCKNSTIIKASDEDLRSIMPGMETEEAVAFLLKAGAKNVVVTLGGRGALYCKEGSDEIRYVNAFKASSKTEDGTLDFTGAGDSFGAGFMARFAAGAPMDECVLNGNATASLVVEKTGGCIFSRMPDREKIDSRLAEGNSTTEELIEEIKKTIVAESRSLEEVADQVDEAYADAVRVIMGCGGRLIVTGLGKTGHVASKIAASFASLGVPSFFVHSCESLHGDMGMITGDDVVIMISNSGKSQEILNMLPSLRIIGAKTISITKDENSPLAKGTDICLKADAGREADHLGLAPTTSSTAALAVGDALATTVSRLKGIKREDFALRHPGGALGQALIREYAEKTGEKSPGGAG